MRKSPGQLIRLALMSVVVAIVLAAVPVSVFRQPYQTFRLSSAMAVGIPVVDLNLNSLQLSTNIGVILNKLEQGIIYLKEKADDQLFRELLDKLREQSKQLFANFIDNTNETITQQITTGGPGGTPLFYRQTIGDYKRNVEQVALTEFETTLAENPGAINPLLDTPGGRVAAERYLRGLEEERNPSDDSIPNRNTEALIASLTKYNPAYQVITIDQALQGFLKEEVSTKLAQRAEGEGYQPVLDSSGNIQTPAQNVQELDRQRVENLFRPAEFYTESESEPSFLANLISSVNKNIEKYFGKGKIGTQILDAFGVSQIINDVKNIPNQLVRQGINQAETLVEGGINDLINNLLSKDSGSSNRGSAIISESDLRSGSSGSLVSGTRASETLRTGQSGQSITGQANFTHFLSTGSGAAGPYDLLAQLSTCTDPEDPAPDECVIDSGFRIAIERELTVREAIDQGLINGDAPFGFDPPGFEPFYRTGFPYRSLLILRSHRVIPVTWEIAAQMINRFGQGRTVTLNDLIGNFNNNRSDDPNSIYYGLVDPDWVLKAPETICRGEAFGEKIISENITPGSDANNDGDFIDIGDRPPLVQKTRAEYCVDYQGCIHTDENGNCTNYGYCTEEARIWNLNGNECAEQFASCRVYQNNDGNLFGYLENSLEYNNCNSENAGCLWYCNEYNTVNNIWACGSNGERVLKTCETPGGCSVQAGCVVSEGQYHCNDDVQSVDIVLTSACTPGSLWWTGSQCEVSSSCTIEQGGVACITTGCEANENLLTNASFETSAGPGGIAAGWSEVDDDPTLFFERTGAAQDWIHNGNYSLRFFSFGGSNTATLESDVIQLTAGSGYTFSGYVYNRLNLGTIQVSLVDRSGNPLQSGNDSTSPLAVRTSTVKRDWEQVSVNFIAPGTGEAFIRIKVGNGTEQVSGTAWFDNFKIAESCISSPAVLTLIGGEEKDGSKLHFDRDVKQCSGLEAGCSEFYQTAERLDENIFANGTLTQFTGVADDGTVDDYALAGSSIVGTGVELFAVTDPGRNDTALKVQKTSGADSYAQVAIAPQQPSGITYGDRRFFVSFLAKAMAGFSIADCQNEGGAQGCLENDHSNAIRYVDGDVITHISMDGLTDASWQRFYATFTTDTRETADELELLLRPATGASGSYVLYDDIELIEIGEFQSLDPVGPHPLATQQVHVRKAPDSLECRGYTIERPSPYVLDGVFKEQCTGDTLLWTKVCVGGDNPGVACNNSADCGGGECVPNNCDASGQFCCHELDPGECFNYALYCEADEVGCEAYTPVAGGAVIPGVVAYDDYCPSECVGYDAYKQAPSIFEAKQNLEYFIPNTADQCRAADAGCTEFTNLDEVASGGEGREFYKELRMCVTPDDPAANCTAFFAWQGDDETGYQLTSYSLQADRTGAPEDVIDPTTNITSWPDEWCSNKTLDGNGLPACCNEASDTLTNPFCKELLDINGNIHYRIYDNTISCSDSCQPLRKRNYGDDLATAQVNCEISHGTWQDNSCFYNALPRESASCTPAAGGCREYRGNAGANVFVAFGDTFEDGDSVGWRYGQISSTALTVGGHSLRSINSNLATSNPESGHVVATSFGDLGDLCNVNMRRCENSTDRNCFSQQRNACVVSAVAPAATSETCTVAIGQRYCGGLGDTLKTNATYLLSFWARSATTNIPELAIAFVAEPGPTPSAIGQVSLNTNWRYYELGPFNASGLNRSARLVFANDSTDFFIDNIEVREVSEYAYVIKDSWQTPASCDTNPYISPAQPAPQFMLGCAAYRDTQNVTHTLKSFDHLCREDAVGCEALIDTHNSDSIEAMNYNPGDGVGDVKVPADELVYLTVRDEFRCNSANQGCQSVGLPAVLPDGKVVSHQNVYLINDPDQYDSILCGSGEVYCEEFQSTQGFNYFKEPGARLCDYREIDQAPNGVAGWYKINSDEQCPVERSPLGNIHPGDGWAGLCPSEANGCTEYIDPISEIGKNIVFNADFDQDTEGVGQGQLGDGIPDGWNLTAPDDARYLEQVISVKPDTLYTLRFTNVVPPFDTPFLNNSDIALKFSIGVIDCPGVTSFDTTMTPYGTCSISGTRCSRDTTCGINGGVCQGINSQLEIPSSSFVGDWSSARPDLPRARSFSGHFYVPNTVPAGTQCKVRLEFIAPQDDSGAPLTIDRLVDNDQGVVNEVAVTETGRYYYLDTSVDTFSCNGRVNPEEGCVLFNDRSNVNYHIGACIAGTYGARCSTDADCDTTPGAQNGVCSYETDTTYLQFDADVSGASVNNGVPISANQGCAGNCDSDVVIQVRPDRECSSWLSCSTTIKMADQSGVERDYCIALAECDSFDANGKCNSLVPPVRQRVNELLQSSNEPGNLTARRADSKLLSNLTGYTTAGITINDVGALQLSSTPYQNQNTVHGYYPYGTMRQVGEVTAVPNGNFENITGNRQPRSWSNIENIPWNAAQYSVLNNPVEGLNNGISILEGSAVMRLNSSVRVISEFIETQPNTRYVLSTWLNTLNLQPFNSRAVVLIASDDISQSAQGVNLGTPYIVGSTQYYALATLNARSDWTNRITQFTTGLDTTSIQLVLANWLDGGLDASGQQLCLDADDNKVCDVSGSSFFDRIELLPTLEAQDRPPLFDPTGDTEDDTKLYLSRSCRAYPEESSLSCEYTDTNGILQKGTSGYCLVKDSQNPDVCLQWWPIDLILGDSLEYTPAYSDRTPLYHCLQMKDDLILAEEDVVIVTTNGAEYRFDAPNDLKPSEICFLPKPIDYYYDNGVLSQSASRYTDYFSDDSGGDHRLSSSGNAWFRSSKHKFYQRGSLCEDGCWQSVCVDINGNVNGDGDFNGSVCNALSDCFAPGTDLNDPGLDTSVACVKPPVCGDSICDSFPAGDPRCEPDVCKPADDLALPYCSDPVCEPNRDGWPAIASLDNGLLNNGFCLSTRTPTVSDFPSSNGFRLELVYNNDGSLAEYVVRIQDDDNDSSNFSFDYIYYRTHYCSVVAKTVSSAGSHKAWTTRIAQGSEYEVPDLRYSYDSGITESNFPPFGSIVPPNPVDNPSGWNGGTSDGVAYPLPYLVDPADTALASNARAGTPYSCEGNCAGGLLESFPVTSINSGIQAAVDRISRLFARSFGLWQWDLNLGQEQYTPIDGADLSLSPAGWDVPTLRCENNTRPLATCEGTPIPCTNSASCEAITQGTSDRCMVNGAEISSTNTDYCGVQPVVTSMSVNGVNDSAAQPVVRLRSTTANVNLSFNLQVNENQLPLRSYRVDWGDGKQDVISGISIRDRSNIDQPFVLQHLYSYYDALANANDDEVYCSFESEPDWWINNYVYYFDVDTAPGFSEPLGPNQCAIRPKVYATDNWGFCTGNLATSTNVPVDCSNLDDLNVWIPFSGVVIIEQQP